MLVVDPLPLATPRSTAPAHPLPTPFAPSAILLSQARDCADTAARMAALQASAVRMPR